MRTMDLTAQYPKRIAAWSIRLINGMESHQFYRSSFGK